MKSKLKEIIVKLGNTAQAVESVYKKSNPSKTFSALKGRPVSSKGHILQIENVCWQISEVSDGQNVVLKIKKIK